MWFGAIADRFQVAFSAVRWARLPDQIPVHRELVSLFVVRSALAATQPGAESPESANLGRTSWWILRDSVTS
jgi:hypothetical protein